MTRDTPVRWGVLGAANIALQKVIPAMQSGCLSRVVAIASRDLAKARAAADALHIERAYGSFTRTFSLPDDADPQQVNAEFKDGVLNVHVAKDKNARPKAIEVKVT